MIIGSGVGLVLVYQAKKVPMVTRLRQKDSVLIGSGARERAALPLKTPIGNTRATGLAALAKENDA